MKGKNTGGPARSRTGRKVVSEWLSTAWQQWHDLFSIRPSTIEGERLRAFDVAFYRSDNPGLSHLDDRQLRKHYRRIGQREGRPATFKHFLAAFAAEGRPVPFDFDPVAYRQLHPDVDRACASDLDAYRHYAHHGAGEGRRYRNPQRDASPRDDEVARQERENDPELMALVRKAGLTSGYWLGAFCVREFSLLNFRWNRPTTSLHEAIHRFMNDGISRLAPISRAARFDVTFYRLWHPELAKLDNAAVYRSWLTGDDGQAHERSPEAWLQYHRLDLAAFPEGFDWRSYAALALPELDSQDADAGWKALAHLAANVSRQWILTEPSLALDLALANLALHCHDPETALGLFERAAANGGATPALIGAGHAQELAGRWDAAAVRFGEACDAAGPMLDLRIRQANALIHAGNSAQAAESLVQEGAEWAAVGRWRQTMSRATDTFFARHAETALSLIRAGDRRAGDAVITSCVHQLEDWYRRAIPDVAFCGPTGHVRILAITEPPQCVHYRVEQKIDYLGLAGRQSSWFRIEDADEFTAMLPGAAAAIFYRLPATPAVVRAIVSARQLGIACYYEVDDLIFDTARYPDTIETFQGAITRDTYEQLQLFTPLHRAAMSLCDEAIASTPMLAAAMRPVVRRQKSILLRNGLDRRLLDVAAQTTALGASARPIRLFYGSATLSHSKDVNDIAHSVLLPLLKTRRDVTFVVAGLLDLNPAFEEVSDQIVRVDTVLDSAAYWQLLSTCDINLAILSSTAMNDCKSEIKWLEAAAFGIPSIVSATATYRDVIHHGRTGWLAETIDDFAAGVALLVSDEKRRADMGREARRVAEVLYAPRHLTAPFAAQLPPPTSRDFPHRRRVLLVNVYYPPQAVGGATRIVTEQVATLKQAPFDDRWAIGVAATDEGNESAHERSFAIVDSIPVYRIAALPDELSDWRTHDVAMKTWFADVIASFQPDMVHFHCIQRLTASVIEACEEAAVPWMISIHDGWWISDYQFLFDENGRAREADDWEKGLRPGISYAASLARRRDLHGVLSRASVVTVPSETFRALHARAGVGTTVVANGVARLPVLPRKSSASGRVRLAHIGDASPHKGADLVEAALRAGRFDRLELTMLSYDKDTNYQSNQCWGATPVTIRGRIPQDSMPLVYAETDVLLAPSACVESFGLVTREANQAGVWVVASNRGAIGEDVQAGVDGFVIDVSTPDALFDVLSRINDDPERFRAAVSARPAREMAEQVADFVDIYDVLIAARSPVPDP